jgi:hypothetical protein
LANGWAESPVTAAAISAVVANKVPMVAKNTGPGQVERHEGCDVMCSRMDPDNIHSHVQFRPTRSQSLTRRNHDQDPGCFNSSMELNIHAGELQHGPREP